MREIRRWLALIVLGTLNVGASIVLIRLAVWGLLRLWPVDPWSAAVLTLAALVIGPMIVLGSFPRSVPSRQDHPAGRQAPRPRTTGPDDDPAWLAAAVRRLADLGIEDITRLHLACPTCPHPRHDGRCRSCGCIAPHHVQ